MCDALLVSEQSEMSAHSEIQLLWNHSCGIDETISCCACFMLCMYFIISHMNEVNQSLFFLIAHALTEYKAHPVHVSRLENKVVK